MEGGQDDLHGLNEMGEILFRAPTTVGIEGSQQGVVDIIGGGDSLEGMWWKRGKRGWGVIVALARYLCGWGMTFVLV